MELTGVGDGSTYDGVYVSPYWGTIQGNGVDYQGYMICDDYSTESYVGQSWSATAENATSLNGSEKFPAGYTNPANEQTYNAQQTYDAVAYLADELMTGSNDVNYTDQVYLSFAIWGVMDSSLPVTGTVQSLITSAFKNTANGYTGPSVSVFTPNPKSASQEFLVVNGPTISTPEPAAAAFLGSDLLAALVCVFLLRRYRVRS